MPETHASGHREEGLTNQVRHAILPALRDQDPPSVTRSRIDQVGSLRIQLKLAWPIARLAGIGPVTL